MKTALCESPLRAAVVPLSPLAPHGATALCEPPLRAAGFPLPLPTLLPDLQKGGLSKMSSKSVACNTSEAMKQGAHIQIESLTITFGSPNWSPKSRFDQNRALNILSKKRNQTKHNKKIILIISNFFPDHVRYGGSSELTFQPF